MNNTGKFSTFKTNTAHASVNWLPRPMKALVRWDILNRVFVILTIAGLISYLLLPKKQYSWNSGKVGEIARESFASDNDYLITDEASTKLLQNQATETVPPIFDYDPDLTRETLNKIETFFGGLTNISKLTANQAAALENLSNQLQINASVEDLRTLIKTNGLSSLHTTTSNVLNELLINKYLLDNRDNLPWNPDLGIEVRNLHNEESKLLYDLRHVYDLSSLRQELANLLSDRIKKIYKSSPEQAITLLSNILPQILRANLNYNTSASEERRRLIAASVKTVTIPIQTGEVLINKGERITPRHLLMIQGIQIAKGKINLSKFFVSRFLLVVLLLGTVFLVARRFLTDFNPKIRDLYLMMLLIVSTLLLTKLGMLLSERLIANSQVGIGRIPIYIVPFAVGAMIVQMVLSGSYTMVYSLLLSLAVACLYNFDLQFSTYALLSCVYGAVVVTKCQTRTGLFRAAMHVSAFNLLVALIYNFTDISSPFDHGTSYFYLAGLMLPISAVMLFLALSLITPMVEYFDYITDMKLIELANFNNPLLNRLALEAPGTYHHSRVVAQLVEAAAESVGARPQLAMVSALYHDIGKIKNPQYFTENQTAETRNIHDKLKPSMSKMIIVAHIKDGVEMARKAGLPSAIVRGIPEHHGTSLITFFYHKAKDQEDPELDEIEENEFRYPGPKPQSKETALLLLADSVEAATKALPEPSAEKIQGVIQRIFNKYFADGQLNECDLTLKDLNLIAKSFFRTLTSVYKPRVEYPEVIPASGGTQKANPKVKKTDANRNQQSSKAVQNRQKDDDDEDGEDLKRLGL
jgi:putative nucleotidyltransferase with HDIG domain